MTTITRNIQVSSREVEKEWMTRKELAKFLGVSTQWVKKHNLSGDLPFSKFCGTAFIPLSEVRKLLKNNMVYGNI